ncbi:MAG: hypothetical protein GY913_01815 [Proteobacteria bacterium]|nr:hypothetical protein [Pseudomonadota bacterium]MCP4915637.1 hypothetical protein [Pseudomonadota bacterium]
MWFWILGCVGSGGDSGLDSAVEATSCPLDEAALELDWSPYTLPCGEVSSFGPITSEEDFVAELGCDSDIDWAEWRLVGFDQVVDLPNARITQVYSLDGTTVARAEIPFYCGGANSQGEKVHEVVLIPAGDEPVELQVCEYGGCGSDTADPA